MEKDKRRWALKPDAQPFDEIRIRIVPRFKDSELSGSEWRISTEMHFFRNGELIHSDSCGGQIEYGAGVVYSRLLTAQDNGKGYYASDGVHCDQEGCPNKMEFVYKIKQGYDRCGNKSDSYTGYHRGFCSRHKHRGDQSLEDSDANYELVETIEPDFLPTSGGL